jgi:hypothetical protein
MGYVAPTDSVDVSNSNTSGVIDSTNPVTGPGAPPLNSSRWGSSIRHPAPIVSGIAPGPDSNGHSPYATGRGHFKRSWFVVAVAVGALIILGVVVHW